MTDRPILFSGPMVRALLAGDKTQTRRIIKPQPTDNPHRPLISFNHGTPEWSFGHNDIGPHRGWWRCPYGMPGDRLYVREAHHIASSALCIYRANWRADAAARGFDNIPARETDIKWRPGIHHPRAYSRLTLTITDVRIERLNEISEADAQAEGIIRIGREYASFADPESDWHDGPNLWTVDIGDFSANSPLAAGAYSMLWETINGDGSWAANPWVWAVSFTVAKRNIDQGPA